jgi:thioredoxin reductase (NADPH)
MIDVVIVGGGPSGLFSCFMCGMQKLRCHIFDPLPFLGGQCRALYPEKPIYDIPAYPSITANDLVLKLEEQISVFNPSLSLGEKIIKIDFNHQESFWVIEGDKGTVVETKSIIIASGPGAFGPNRPPIDHIETYEPHSIHYCVTNKSAYKDKRIVIAGGGDSAVDWALELSQIASKVTLVHRRARFRCSPHSEEKLKNLIQNGTIILETPYQLHAIEGENSLLRHVIIKNLDADEKKIECDVLLPFFGLSTNLGFIENLTDNHKTISVDPTTSQTKTPGIYAVGDISGYPNKNKLIVCGFAEAAQAAHAIRKYIFPDEVVHFEYSTTKGVRGLG